MSELAGDPSSPPDDGEMSGAIEIRGAASAMIDEPLTLRARGAGAHQEIVWRARLLDDDGRAWKSTAARAQNLHAAWIPVKPSVGSTVAALSSLRPVGIDVRVQAADGRSAARRLSRHFLADGVQLRRWRDGPAASLYLPAEDAPCAAVILDATGDPRQALVATLAAPLLASRGALVLAVVKARATTSGSQELQAAHERMAAVPSAAGIPLQVLGVAYPDSPPGDGDAESVVGLPPGIAATGEDPAANALAWDRLLASLGARPREV